MTFKKLTVVFAFVVAIVFQVNAQGFLHAEGKNIVDGNGENVVLRGIGTGN